MGLQSGGGVVVAVASSCSGGIAEVEAPLGGVGGGGGSHIVDPITGAPLHVSMPQIWELGFRWVPLALQHGFEWFVLAPVSVVSRAS
jgi:hypothetical protein